MIRKMQTAAGGSIKEPIKRLKDGYRYIPDEQNGGWDRISDNSMSDVFATMEFTPKKTSIDSPITRKQSVPSKTYYSAYNPDDIVKGFNALTLGGLNNLSPTQWVRRYYDLNRLLVSLLPGPKTMTWSGFVNNWLNGNNGLVSNKFAQLHPYWSIGINGVGDAVMGAGALGSIKTKNPPFFISKKDMIKLYDNFAPKTNVVIDGSKEGFGLYELLTPRSKYFRDRLFFNKEYQQARQSGQYPLTFAERRKYLSELNSDYLGTRNRLLERRVNDYNIRHPEVINEYGHIGRGDNWQDTDHANLLWDSGEEYFLNLDFTVPRKVNFVSKEGNVKFNGNQGFYLPTSNKIYAGTRKRNSLLPALTKRQMRGLNAHEADHAVLKASIDFRELEDTPTATELKLIQKLGYLPYHEALNKEHYMFNDYAPVTELYRGSWFGSPNEINSEMQNVLELLETTISYRDLPEDSKLFVNEYMSDRFNTDINSPVWKNISKKGFFKQGGKMNAIEQFKQGSKIHIKKKNRGKFTAYCGGNVTSACIAKAKASGNPTLVKRATFAANARKWKHLNGGILVTPEMEQNRYQGEVAPGKGFTDKLKDVGKALGQFIPFIGTALDTEERQGYAAAVGAMKDIGIPAFTYTANNKLSNRTYRGWDRKRHRNKNYGKPYINSRLTKPLAKGLGIVGLILDTPNMVSDLENLKRALGFNYNHQLLMKELKGGKLCLIPRN